MTASVMIHVRVSEDVKTQAAETLALMGLSVSDACAGVPDACRC